MSQLRVLIGTFALVSIVFAAVASTPSTGIPPERTPAQPLDRAFEYLDSAMDRYYDRFYIYADGDSGGNHYYPSLLLNGDKTMSVDGNWNDHPHSGKSCIKISFTGENGLYTEHWNGVSFQDTPTWDGSPPDPFSAATTPHGPGFNLTGATRLEGWIRSDTPQAHVELYVGGESDSLERLPPIIPKLSKEWQQFQIDLHGLNLSRVSTGLTVVYEAPADKVQPCVVYLDDIEFDLPRPRLMHLIPSYEPHATLDDPSTRNVAYLYDNSLAILALLARHTPDDLDRARKLCDALCYCREHNVGTQDGRLYNGYMTGDIPVHIGEPTRLPGWWDAQSHKYLQDRFQVSTNTGNIAWSILALLACHDATPGDSKFLSAAVDLGEWVQANCTDPARPIGYTGGWEGWQTPRDPNPHAGQKPATYKSTEMNLDLIAAFARLYQETRKQKWVDRAHNARKFVESMFLGDRFATGTQLSNDDKNLGPKPLDVNTWAMLVLGPNEQTRRALEWAKSNCAVGGTAGDGFTGYGFDDEQKGAWWEGTGQMSCALRTEAGADRADNIQHADDEAAQADDIIHEMERWQATAPDDHGQGIFAASRDGMPTGLPITTVDANGEEHQMPWLYYHQVHLGATMWFVFAELGYNPYWMQSADKPIPDWDHPVAGASAPSAGSDGASSK